MRLILPRARRRRWSYSPTVTYDAILLDVRLPGLSGIQVCRELRQQGMEAPFLCLTARGLVEQRVRGARRRSGRLPDEAVCPRGTPGARGALVPAGPDTAATPSYTMPTWSLTVIAAGLPAGRWPFHSPPRNSPLLELFLLHAPDLVTRSEIVEHVWDRHFDSETNLVEVYVNRLRQED